MKAEPEDKIIEEMGELLHAIGKSRRFGLFNNQPGTEITNRLQVLCKISDVRQRLREYEIWIEGQKEVP